MLPSEEYVEQSLSTNLFFLRISKEHSLFLESSFTPRNTNLMETAGYFRRQFKLLLQQAVGMANGTLNQRILQSGQIITTHTLNAELLTQKYIGTVIDTSLTKQEERLQPGFPAVNDLLESRIYDLNQRAIATATALAEFIGVLIADVKKCRLYMTMYPLLMDHILRETNSFIHMLVLLQNRINPLEQRLTEQEAFWNRILGEHAAFTGSMLDPTEQLLKNTVNKFAQEFSALADIAGKASIDAEMARTVTEQSLNAAKDARDFNMVFTRGQLQCQILSVLIPLAMDHDTRETSFYIYQVERATEIVDT